MNAKKDILIGNSFAFTLIRREVRIVRLTLEAFRREAADARIHSYWGHTGTIASASAFLGVDVKPSVERPTVALTPDKRPTLDGIVFDTCYVCSPEAGGVRPKIGEELSSAAIADWTILKISTSRRSRGSKAV